MFRKTFVAQGPVMAIGITAIIAATPAMAAGEHCTAAPVTEWKSVQEISTDAAGLGYSVMKVEREGTCYEVEGYDRNGAKIEILYNPETGKPARRK